MTYHKGTSGSWGCSGSPKLLSVFSLNTHVIRELCQRDADRKKLQVMASQSTVVTRWWTERSELDQATLPIALSEHLTQHMFVHLFLLFLLGGTSPWLCEAMQMWAYMYSMHTLCMVGAYRCQQKVLDLLELEWVCELGTQHSFSERAAHASEHLATSSWRKQS